MIHYNTAHTTQGLKTRFNTEIQNYEGGKFRHSQQTKRVQSIFERTINQYKNLGFSEKNIPINDLKLSFFTEIDQSTGLMGETKKAAKKSFNTAFPTERASSTPKIPGTVYVQSFTNSQIQDMKKHFGTAISNYAGGKYSKSHETKVVKDLFSQTADNYQIGSLNDLKIVFFKVIDQANLTGPTKYAAKNSFEAAFKNAAISKVQPTVIPNKNATDCTFFRLKTSKEITNMYRPLQAKRTHTHFSYQKGMGGAASVGYDVYRHNPHAKIGVMLAANSGLPGGGLGRKVGRVTEHDLNVKTQEESVWANAILTECGKDPAKQTALHKNTIEGAWGMFDAGKSQDTTAFKKIGPNRTEKMDYTKANHASAFNGVFVVKGRSLTPLKNVNGTKQMRNPGAKYPVSFVFADSVNAGNHGTATGTMQRTRNGRAVNDYHFFKDCIKEKLRSSLDAMAANGVTHALVAPLSTGIYAGNHKAKIQKDFPLLLNDVLNESVGSKGERRGQFFQDVIIPQLG